MRTPAAPPCSGGARSGRGLDDNRHTAPDTGTAGRTAARRTPQEWRDPRSARISGSDPLLIDRQLSEFDATIVCEIVVDAPPEVTYAAIPETNLLDPVVRGLFRVRELPNRLVGWISGLPVPSTPRSVTLGDLVQPGLGMLVSAEPVHFVMERKMLQGIEACVEQSAS